MIYVIIPVFNRIDKTLRCLKSLAGQTVYNNIKIIIVDDNSSDHTKEIISNQFSNIDIIEGNGNLFWTGSVKFGLNHVLKIHNSLHDHVLIINNDIELIPKTLEILLNESRKNKNSIISPLSVDIRCKKKIIKTGTIIKSWFFNYSKHIYKNCNYNHIEKQNIEVDILTHRCVLFPIKTFYIVGLHDAENFLHYMGDVAYSIRCKYYGFRLILTSKTLVYLDTLNSNDNKKKSVAFHLFSIRSGLNILCKYKF